MTQPTPDGPISVDSPFHKQLGFTSDKFNTASFLWRKGDSIYLSMIIVLNTERHKGHLKALVDKLLSEGLTVKIPTPLGRMMEFVKNHGFTKTIEEDDEHKEMGKCEVWIKEPCTGQQNKL